MIRSPVWSQQEFESLYSAHGRESGVPDWGDRLDPRFRGKGRGSRAWSRVAGSPLAGQTQSRERHHADVSFVAIRKAPPRRPTTYAPQRRTRARGGTLFLRLGGKLQRIALA